MGDVIVSAANCLHLLALHKATSRRPEQVAWIGMSKLRHWDAGWLRHGPIARCGTVSSVFLFITAQWVKHFHGNLVTLCINFPTYLLISTVSVDFRCT